MKSIKQPERKQKNSPEQRQKRNQQIFFSILAFIIIFSWIVSLVAVK
jgi:predicted nucleic acid-binding Zn ribbon protein